MTSLINNSRIYYVEQFDSVITGWICGNVALKARTRNDLIGSAGNVGKNCPRRTPGCGHKNKGRFIIRTCPGASFSSFQCVGESGHRAATSTIVGSERKSKLSDYYYKHAICTRAHPHPELLLRDISNRLLSTETFVQGDICSQKHLYRKFTIHQR